MKIEMNNLFTLRDNMMIIQNTEIQNMEIQDTKIQNTEIQNMEI